MPSERVQRVIDGYLDEIEVAVRDQRWMDVDELAKTAVELDEDNEDLKLFLRLANKKLTEFSADSESSPSARSNSNPDPASTQPPKQSRPLPPVDPVRPHRDDGDSTLEYEFGRVIRKIESNRHRNLPGTRDTLRNLHTEINRRNLAESDSLKKLKARSQDLLRKNSISPSRIELIKNKLRHAIELLETTKYGDLTSGSWEELQAISMELVDSTEEELFSSVTAVLQEHDQRGELVRNDSRTAPVSKTYELLKSPSMYGPDLKNNPKTSADRTTRTYVEAPTIPNGSGLVLGTGAPDSLGGWLVFVGFGLVVGIISGVLSIIVTIEDLVEGYGLIGFGVMVVLVELLLLIGYSWVSYLFFNKKRKFQKAYPILLAIAVASNLGLLSVLAAEVGSFEYVALATGGRVVSWAFWSTIWILYALNSKQIKATFTKD